MIGLLKSLSMSWSYAGVVLPQLKKVAAEVFFTRSGQPESISTGRTPDREIPESETSWLDTLDIQALQKIMNFDIQSMGLLAG
jgi:hypothetical protein